MSDWTEEREADLKRMYGDGFSFSQITAALGGVSRNAVIGKAHRLGLSRAATPAYSTPPRVVKPRKPRSAAPLNAVGRGVGGMIKARVAAVKAYVPPPKPTPIEDIIVPISRKVSLLDLNDTMCKWPDGDPGTPEFGFCGHRNWNGLVYCEYHSRLAYQPVERRDGRLRTPHLESFVDWRDIGNATVRA